MKTLHEVREAGITALANSLGPVDAIRFLQQYDSGHGDYTAERKKLLGDPTVDALMEQIRSRRATRRKRSR